MTTEVRRDQCVPRTSKHHTESRRPLLKRTLGFAIAATLLSILPVGQAHADDRFSDVPSSHLFHDSIRWLASSGITSGCNPPANDRFCPEEAVSRGEMAAFFARAFGFTDRLDDPFVDDDGSTFEADIERLAAAGVTKGCNPPANDRFCPEEAVSRGEMAAFFARAFGFTNRLDDPFVDDDGSTFEADIERLAAAGVTKGCNPPANDRFCPEEPVTRAQFAAFLHRTGGGSPSGEWPSAPSRVGTLSPDSELTPSGTFTTSSDGQVIEGLYVTGQIKIAHDNVTVRNTKVDLTGDYGLYVPKRNDGSCPVGTVFENVEVDGRLLDDTYTPVYGNGCGFVLSKAYIHNTGQGVKVMGDVTVKNSYIVTSRADTDGPHRTAISVRGSNNKILNNYLVCSASSGCSSALSVYTDAKPVDNVLIEGNLLAGNAAYCARGGSVERNGNPPASNVDFIDNAFSLMFHPQCGRSGFIAAHDTDIDGNERSGNYVYETGQPIP